MWPGTEASATGAGTSVTGAGTSVTGISDESAKASKGASPRNYFASLPEYLVMEGIAKTAGEAGAIELIEADRPEPGPEEALVEVAYAGICGSDLGIYTFKSAFEFMEFPRIVGHEYSGTVVETGEDVSRVSVGDRVVEEPIRACGECHHCRSGHANLCVDARITGIHHDGAFTRYVAVPEDHLHHLPDDVSLAQASILEPTSVAARAVQRLSRVSAGDEVLVEGPGPIGLLTAQIADVQGGNVLVTGVDQDATVRLPMAEELGFDTCNVGTESLDAAMTARTDGLGFDVTLDTTGHPSGLETAVEVTKKGGQVMVVGLGGPTELDYADLLRAELDLQCSYASDWGDFERAIRLVRDDDVETEAMVDTRFSLADADDAFRAALDADTVKVRFEVAGE